MAQRFFRCSGGDILNAHGRVLPLPVALDRRARAALALKAAAAHPAEIEALVYHRAFEAALGAAIGQALAWRRASGGVALPRRSWPDPRHRGMDGACP